MVRVVDRFNLPMMETQENLIDADAPWIHWLTFSQFNPKMPMMLLLHALSLLSDVCSTNSTWAVITIANTLCDQDSKRFESGKNNLSFQAEQERCFITLAAATNAAFTFYGLWQRRRLQKLTWTQTWSSRLENQLSWMKVKHFHNLET